MVEPVPPDLLLAAPPDAPGARQLLDAWVRCATGRSGARLLLVGGGLAWAADGGLARAVAGGDVAVCTRNANDAGWRLETAPAGIRWSSVALWLVERQGDAALWVALP